MDIEEFRTNLDAARKEYDRARFVFHQLLNTCPHKIMCGACQSVTGDEACSADHFGFGHGEAVCIFCKQNFGWYCHKSPDRTCYYYSDERKGKTVTLKSGQKIDLPAEHEAQARWESDDFCLFCGGPDERK
jgi:hypothetical protein